jgi:hypothetical protein
VRLSELGELSGAIGAALLAAPRGENSQQRPSRGTKREGARGDARSD